MNNQPEEKKEVPMPPPSRVNIRTMQSDLESIQESGGQAPQPYSAELDKQPKKEISQEEISSPVPQLEPNIPGYTGPEEPIFQPGAPTFPAEKKPPLGELKPKGKGFKTVMIISGILILVVGLGLTGYYVIFPRFFVSKVEAPTVVTPTPTPEPEIPPPAPAIYSSLLKTPAALTEEIIISQLTLESFKDALRLAATSTPVGSFKEVIIRNEDQSLIGFSKLMPVFLPELTTEKIAEISEDNFTAFIFVNEQGIWPGYIAQIKSTTPLIQAQSFISQAIETSTNLKNLFLEEPGSATSFKDGQAGSPPVTTRYLVFSKPGATLNYGWLNNNLLVSTSYSGFLAVLEKLR